MKNIKTYEEFDWHQSIQDNWGVAAGIAGWFMAYFGTKFLSVIKLNSTVKKRFKDMMSDNYPNRNWIIEKDGYIIKLIQKFGFNKESNLKFGKFDLLQLISFLLKKSILMKIILAITPILCKKVGVGKSR